MTPEGRIVLDDAQGYADLRIFVARARQLDEDGAVRFQADGTVLAAYVGVLPGRGLMGDGAVVGLRTMRLGRPTTLDATVALAAVGDRLARDTSAGLELPPVTVQTAWAAMTPPRAGWEPVGSVDAEALVVAARAGIAEVAQGGADRVRRSGRDRPSSPGLGPADRHDAPGACGCRVRRIRAGLPGPGAAL